MKIKIRTNNKNILSEGFDAEPEPNEEEEFLKSRLTNKDIEEPGVKDLLKLGYIPIVKPTKNTSGIKHSILLGQGFYRQNL